MSETKEKIRQGIRCVVISDKMNKSRVGLVEKKVQHKITKKYIKQSTKLMFNDEENKTKIGDVVIIQQCRPVSSRKKFTLSSIVTSASN